MKTENQSCTFCDYLEVATWTAVLCSADMLELNILHIIQGFPHTTDVFLTGISYIANVFLEEFINILKLCLVN